MISKLLSAVLLIAGAVLTLGILKVPEHLKSNWGYFIGVACFIWGDILRNQAYLEEIKKKLGIK